VNATIINQHSKSKNKENKHDNYTSSNTQSNLIKMIERWASSTTRTRPQNNIRHKHQLKEMKNFNDSINFAWMRAPKRKGRVDGDCEQVLCLFFCVGAVCLGKKQKRDEFCWV